MNHSLMTGSAILALAVLAPVATRADAVDDQKKAYKALGVKLERPPAMCNLITKSEAAHALGKPVSDGESAGILAGCAYRSTDGSNDGVLVIRNARKDWNEPTRTSQYHPISGVGEKAYTALEPSLGYEAGVLAANGVTIVQLSGKGSATTALALARIAMKR